MGSSRSQSSSTQPPFPLRTTRHWHVPSRESHRIYCAACGRALRVRRRSLWSCTPTSSGQSVLAKPVNEETSEFDSRIRLRPSNTRHERNRQGCQSVGRSTGDHNATNRPRKPHTSSMARLRFSTEFASQKTSMVFRLLRRVADSKATHI